MGYPLARLSEEVAYIAYHFHWPYEQVMQLEHRERQQWVGEIARINQRINHHINAESEAENERWR